MSYIGPAIWNTVPEILKKSENLNIFQYEIKYY